MAWYNNLGDLAGDITGRLPSIPALVGSNMVPGGGLIGSALNHTLGSDIAKGAANTPLALAGVSAFGGTGNPTTGDPGAGTDGSAAGGAAAGGSSIVDQAVAAAKLGGSFLLDFLKNHGTDLLQAAGVANAAYRQTESDKYAKQALSGVQDRYNAKEPLRVAGMAGMLNPSANTPDLSSLRSIAGPNSGNPFAPKTLPGALPFATNSPPSATPTVNGPPPGPVFMPGGSQTAPRPLPIQRAPQAGLIPRPGNGATLS